MILEANQTLQIHLLQRSFVLRPQQPCRPRSTGVHHQLRGDRLTERGRCAILRDVRTQCHGPEPGSDQHLRRHGPNGEPEVQLVAEGVVRVGVLQMG